VIHLIQTAQEIAVLAEELRKDSVIGIDTEFIRETSFYPKIALIQIATAKKSWLVDPLKLSKNDMAPLIEVFVDPGILKVFHAAFADVECLYWEYGVLTQPVFDTAVGAALLGLGESIGLAKLCQIKLNVLIEKGRARVKWLQRPLPQELLHYAEQDVAHLVTLALLIKKELETKKRFEWACDESALSVSDFDVSPEEIATKLSKNLDSTTFLVLTELIRWREGRARSANLPRGWITENEVLVSLAKVKPKSMEQLKTFRGLHIKELERSGEQILDAIEKGKKAPTKNAAVSERFQIPTEEEELAVDLLRAFISYVASEHAIIPRYLLPPQRYYVLLREWDRPPEEWVKSGILTAQASEMIGESLRQFLNGEKALALKKGELSLMDVGKI
jgi:ribonuclease D